MSAVECEPDKTFSPLLSHTRNRMSSVIGATFVPGKDYFSRSSSIRADQAAIREVRGWTGGQNDRPADSSERRYRRAWA